MRRVIFTAVMAFVAIIALHAQTANNDASTVTWALTSGNITDAPAYTPTTASQFIEKAEITIGSGLKVDGAETSDVDHVVQTKFLLTSNSTSASDANAVIFLLTLKDGIAFTPKKVSLNAFRLVTNEGSMDITWLCDDTKKTLVSNTRPNRSTGSGASTVSTYVYDLDGTPASEKTCGIKVNMYNLKSGKGISLGNVVIEGTLYGTVGQPLTYTLNVNVSPEGAGTIQASPAGPAYQSGTAITLTQHPTEGYVFAGWRTASGKTLSTSDCYTFNIKGNVALTADYVTEASLLVNDYIIVSNKDEFREAIKQVNKDTSGKRQFIFLKNGDYDYGTFYNNDGDKNHYDPSLRDTIKVDNVSIIGQQAKHVSHNPAPATGDTEKGVMIHILPVKEGISTTSPIVNRGNNVYLQDFTIENDYHYSGTARACVWQDEGNHTIGKNMCLLSYQDTYYPHSASGQFYWEDSDIRGVVDFICGNGDVFLNKCRLVNRDRSPYNNTAHEGGATLTAPYTQVENFNEPGGHGFIINECTIDCESQTWDFGRGWRDWPKLAVVNTTLTEQAALRIGADQTKGKAYDKTLRVAKEAIQSCQKPLQFYEYNTIDEFGNINSPETNILTFNGGTGEYSTMTYETILSAEEAVRFQLRNVYPDWQPDKDCRQVVVTSVELSGNTLSWTANEKAKAFLIEKDGEFVAIVDGTQQSYQLSAAPSDSSEGYTVRAANRMGGFGLPLAVGETSGVKPVASRLQPVSRYYDLQGRSVVNPSRGIYIVNGKKVVIK